MAPSRAFQDEVTLGGDYLQVSGQSDILHLCELVARHVAIGQGSHVAEDVPAPPVPAEPPSGDDEGVPAEPPAAEGWTVTVPAAGFAPGPATAIGTEIYCLEDGVTPGLPMLMTVSWSQTVTITGP
ncbi:MAG TPA: hypothetical protein VMY78_06200 [Solirubrobacteraceae bacterium]|nr:hypothetical protein [Solirubrobacteraceae bacterium]